MPGFAADGGRDGFGGNFADACQLFQPDAFFETLLRAVARVLQGATAAVVVMGAGGGDAVGRGGEDLHRFAFEEAFFVAADAGGNALTGQRAADEGGFAVVAGDAAGVVIEAGDVEGEGVGHNWDGKRLTRYFTPLRR